MAQVKVFFFWVGGAKFTIIFVGFTHMCTDMYCGYADACRSLRNIDVL